MPVRKQTGDFPVDPRRAVRARFLAPGNRYGCAESVLLTLEEAFGLDGDDGAAAMALNGGIAYSGATCGAITGAAVALGRLAASRIPDRARAKRVARELTAATLDAFEARFGASDCRTLTGIDLRAPGGHDAFIAAGTWRTSCLQGLQLVVERLAPLGDERVWSEAVAAIGDADPRTIAPAGGTDLAAAPDASEGDPARR
jgi:C_GCAxxG_C_C family probable redox protein